MFFKQLHHSLCSANDSEKNIGRSDPHGGAFSFQAQVKRILEVVREMLIWQLCDHCGVSIEEEEMSMLAILGRDAYPDPINVDILVENAKRNGSNSVNDQCMHGVIEKAMKVKALERNQITNEVAVCETQYGAVLMACGSFVPESDQTKQRICL